MIHFVNGQTQPFVIEWQNFSIFTCVAPSTIQVSLFNCVSPSYENVDDMSCLQMTTIDFDGYTCQATATTT
ncbi:hypothetical protein I4U23_001589 [Adineta vaga]|nr:hypothetical protein I4U23_001589 [Adineta vaga]